MGSSRKSYTSCIILFFIIHPFLWYVSVSAASNTLHPGNSLNSSQTLTSSKGSFSLGFFKPESSHRNSTYLAIKYNDNGYLNEQSIVWIANRDEPIDDINSGILTLDSMGKLMINYKGGKPIELYKGSESAAVNTSATLLENGNFVVREVNYNAR